MNDPLDDQEIKDEEENVTAHPSGAEGEGAQIESSKDAESNNEYNSQPEIEVSKELEDVGVEPTSQPKSLRDDLKEPISEASNDLSTEDNKTITNLNVSENDGKGDIGSGKTWLGALLSKINKLKAMFGNSKNVNEPKSI